jgi:putative transposase
MKSLKVRLELNNKQKTLANRHAGVARYAYNWAVQTCQKAFSNKEKQLSSIDLHKKFVAEEKTKNAWLYEVSKCTPQQTFRNLSTAYDKFHKLQKKSGYKNVKTITVKGEKKTVLLGLPRFKKRGIHDSFYLEGSIRTEKNKIKVPKFGWLKCSEQLPDCEIKNVVISRTADEWFIAFKIPFEHTKHNKNKIIGVDLGIKTLATLSDEKIFDAVKPYKKNKRKLAILQRIVSKKVIGSNNYKKAQMKVAKLHQKIACIRKDSTHKLTTYLAKNHSQIVIEDLNVSGMSKNHKLASAILDGGFFEFRRQLEYKCEWYGSKLTIIDRFYPSSKTCSHCGFIKKDLKLSDRVFKCPACGFEIDRDLNAAINLRKKAVSFTPSTCGVPNQPDASVSGGAVNQEANNILEPLKVQECVSFA